MRILEETVDLFETFSDIFASFDGFTKTEWLFKASESHSSKKLF